MALRLPHVLVMMCVILAAGVLSVSVLESRMGGATVPGLVLIEAPALGADDVEALLARWSGAVVELVPAEREPLAPFDEPLVAALGARGDATTLFCLDQQLAARAQELAADGRRVWKVVIDQVAVGGGAAGAAGTAGAAPAGAGGAVGAAGALAGTDALVERAADYLAAQQGIEAFLVAVVPPPEAEPPVEPIVARMVAAAEALPRFRRTSIVVLGDHLDDAREPARRTVRIDVGEWRRRAAPRLADLLEPGW